MTPDVWGEPDDVPKCSNMSDCCVVYQELGRRPVVASWKFLCYSTRDQRGISSIIRSDCAIASSSSVPRIIIVEISLLIYYYVFIYCASK